MAYEQHLLKKQNKYMNKISNQIGEGYQSQIKLKKIVILAFAGV